MKKILLFLFFIAVSNTHAQHTPDLVGSWSGSIAITGQDLSIDLIFGYDDGELDGTIDIPQQNAFNLPLEVLDATGDTLVFQFQTGTGVAVFYGSRLDNENRVEGDFEQVGMKFPFSISKSSPSNGMNDLFTDDEIIIPTRAGQISGNLTLQEEPSPLVVMLSGSGSQDRDENVAGFRVFQKLSSNLFENGYSTFRYDDRGVGQSVGNADATLDELSEDLVDIVEYLRENYGDKFDELVLFGHSQGGLVATIAAQEEDFSGIIFMGTPFLPAYEIINQQILAISEEQGISDEVVEVNLDFQERIYDVVRSNGDWAEIEEDLAGRLEYQINQLPEQQREALGDMSSFIESQVSRQLAMAKTRWFKSLLEFNISEKIQLLDTLLLALFGEKDMQVLAGQNSEAALQYGSEYDLNLQAVIIPGANHLFQKAETGLPSEYGILDKEFADGFMEAVLSFLENL